MSKRELGAAGARLFPGLKDKRRRERTSVFYSFHNNSWQMEGRG
jgi:hypothetical protein